MTRRDLATGVVAAVLIVGLGTLFLVTGLEMAQWSFETLGVGRPGTPTDVAGAAPPVVGPLPPSPPVPTIGAAAAPLSMPVEGIQASDLHPSFDEPRGGRRHEAIDILAPRGTVVRAVADGRVAKLFTSDAGGLTIYQFDRDERLAYYYAHLDRYRDGLADGDMLRRGEVIGYVGSTGNAADDTPHLHFAIFELGPEKRWWEGRPVDPFPLLRGPRS